MISYHRKAHFLSNYYRSVLVLSYFLAILQFQQQQLRDKLKWNDEEFLLSLSTELKTEIYLAYVIFWKLFWASNYPQKSDFPWHLWFHKGRHLTLESAKRRQQPQQARFRSHLKKLPTNFSVPKKFRLFRIQANDWAENINKPKVDVKWIACYTCFKVIDVERERRLNWISDSEEELW